MEKTTPPGDDQLLQYLDGELSGDLLKTMEQTIQSDDSLRTRLEELRLVHDILKRSAFMEIPSRNFTQRVMSHLDSYPIAPGISPKNGMLLLCGVIVAIGIGMILLSAGTFDALNGPISLDKLPYKQLLNNTQQQIPFNGKLAIKIIMIIATGISFVVLDRTVLKPMFNRRISRL